MVMRATTAPADYLLVFRRPPTAGLCSDAPVGTDAGLTDWPGDPAMDPRVSDYHPSPHARKPRRGKGHDGKTDPMAGSIAVWQRLADPVWFHVDQMDVLNYQLGKGDKDEKHICPLQLGVVREAVYLWTNPGDLVLSPFAGVGSEGFESVRMGRRFVGVELKRSYFDIAAKNLVTAERQATQPSLFDGEPTETEAVPA